MRWHDRHASRQVADELTAMGYANVRHYACQTVYGRLYVDLLPHSTKLSPRSQRSRLSSALPRFQGADTPNSLLIMLYGPVVSVHGLPSGWTGSDGWRLSLFNQILRAENLGRRAMCPNMR